MDAPVTQKEQHACSRVAEQVYAAVLRLGVEALRPSIFNTSYLHKKDFPWHA